MRPAKWPETTFTDVFSPLKLGGDSSQALVQCSDGSGSSSCQFGSNWPFETPPTERDDEVFLPGFSPESQTTTPKIVGDYLDINFDDLRRVRPFLWQLWEQAEACHQDSTYQGFKPDGHGQLYHYDPRELKLFVANFLEDSSLFDVSDSIFGYPQDDAYSSWGWTDMQNVIRRNRISRMCQLFEGDSEEDLDRSDAYMDFILHPAEPMSSSEWSNISQSSTLSQDELETMVKSIRQPSYLEEMWGFGVSFPAEPDLKSLKNFDIHAEVKHHRTLLFTCDSHLLNTHCDSTSRLRNQCAQEHVLSYIDTEISRRLQRKLLQRNVRRALAASCSKLAIGLPQLQSSVRLRALITDSLRVWKTGVNAIDQLLQNSALQVFHDTMCLILVADALRSVGVGTLPSQEPKPFCSSEEWVPPPFSSEPRLTNLKRFFQDLTRWRPHIETCNFDNLSFFDECVRILWPGRQFPALMHPSEPQGNLDHFCMLLSNISSTDIVPETSNDSIPFVYASFPQGQRQGPAHLSRNRAQVIAQLCSDLKNPVPGSENLALYNSFWKDLQPSVVLLSGTIVFGTVLAFFLCMY
jgi:hypothetical protein